MVAIGVYVMVIFNNGLFTPPRVSAGNSAVNGLINKVSFLPFSENQPKKF